MNGRIRIVNGTLLDMEPRRQDLNTRFRAGLWRKIDKWLALKALGPFVLASRRQAAPELGFAGAIPRQIEKGRDDKALVQFHYDLSNDFYALVP